MFDRYVTEVWMSVLNKVKMENSTSYPDLHYSLVPNRPRPPSRPRPPTHPRSPAGSMDGWARDWIFTYLNPPINDIHRYFAVH